MTKRLFIVLLVVAALSFLGVLICWPFMPFIVPTHWSLQGRIDGYSRREVLVLLGAIPLATVLGMRFLPAIDPRRRNYKVHSRAYGIIASAVTGMLILLSWVTLLPAFGIRVPVDRLIYVVIGAAFVVMGNFMPQLRSNFFAGIRTPWALDNEVVWRKTHQAGGLVFCVCGILMVVAALLPRGGLTMIPMGLLLAGMAGVYVYSYAVYRRQGKGLPPQQGSDRDKPAGE